ncbi:DNA adenine methylase [Microbacterium sp. C23T]
MAALVASASERTISYLGNKTRFVGAIADAIDEVAASNTSPVIDPFTGSGAVARYVGQQRPVFASDIQEYARVLLDGSFLGDVEIECAIEEVDRALSRFEGVLSDGDVARLVQFEREAYHRVDIAAIAAMIDEGSLRAHTQRWIGGFDTDLQSALATEQATSLIFQYYGGVYFSYEHALAIDALCGHAKSLDGRLRDAILAVAIRVASQVATTVGGHFAQPIRPRERHGELKPALLRKVAQARRRDTHQLVRETAQATWTGMPACAIHANTLDYLDAIGTAPTESAVVYADPPYTRDHYSRFYHVLETIALGDDPGITVSNLKAGATHSRGLYRTRRHQSPFSIPAQAPGAFDQLFHTARERGFPVVLSYSASYERLDATVRSIDVGDLQRIASDYFESVEMREIEGSTHAQFNRRERAVKRNASSELLLLMRP